MLAGGVALIATLAAALLVHGIIAAGQPLQQPANKPAVSGRLVQRPLTRGVPVAVVAGDVAGIEALIQRNITDRAHEPARNPRGDARVTRPRKPAARSPGKHHTTGTHASPSQTLAVTQHAPPIETASPTTSNTVSGNGSGSSSPAKTGSPPCYLGTLGCQ
jgi:hypothetical protein